MYSRCALVLQYDLPLIHNLRPVCMSQMWWSLGPGGGQYILHLSPCHPLAHLILTTVYSLKAEEYINCTHWLLVLFINFKMA